MTLSRKSIALAFAAPLALALSGCGSTDDADAALDGEPIAAIAAPDGQSWGDVVTVTDFGGYQVGNPDAPLKLVEYASHTCGACANFSMSSAEDLKGSYIDSGVVSFELRNLVRDPIDLAIATLVRCGQPENMQPLADQAWASFNDVMNNAQQGIAQVPNLGDLSVSDRFVAIGEAGGLIDFFSSRGLSADQARSCLADAEAVEAIANASSQQAEELGVQATPTFFLNNQRLEGNQWPQIEPVLQRAGAR